MSEPDFIDLEDSQPEGNTSIENKQSNVFGHALQTWTEIDLPSLQRKLDDEGLQLKEDQKALLLSRKNLAAKTKDYKRLQDEEKLQSFNALLKLYQNEIDTLTKKNKQAEGYFFDVYRVVAEAPDPRPLLELSLDSVMESSDMVLLREEVISLQDELTKKADYEQLKQRLLRSEQRSAETLSSRIAAKEDEFKLLIDEKSANWAKRESQLLKQIDEARSSIEELRTNNEVVQLKLSSQENGDDLHHVLAASTLVELDMALRDADTFKVRILDLERRNEDLCRELSKSQSELNVVELKEEFSKRILELEGENALLTANLTQTRSKLQLNDSETVSTLESTRREVSQLTIENQKLKTKVRDTSDYAEIKQELQLLRQIEFGNGNEVGDDEAGESGDLEIRNIDVILVERNQQLSLELTSFRSQHEGLTGTISDLQAQLENTRKELGRMQELNSHLESDVSNLQDAAANGGSRFNDNASMISGLTKFGRSSIAPGRSHSISQGLIITGTSTTLEENSILPIITKQRDRFKERNHELEEDIKHLNKSISDLKRQLISLKRDNDNLYERTQYVASFKDSSSQARKANSVNSGTAGRQLQPKPNLDIESNRYKLNYETRLNPIEQFRAREQERIHSKLSPLERIFLAFTRAILATPTTRMLFMAYCLGLHLVVVFVSMYIMSLNTSMIPEVGLNQSTGGLATGKVGGHSEARIS